jgi:hypothetical protein
MLGLVDYGSSSEEEPQVGKCEEAKKAAPAARAPPRVGSKAEKKKKKRKLAATLFLPEAVQQALARGDTLQDSSDESESEDLPKPFFKGKHAGKKDLLAMLPQPKAENLEAETVEAVRSSLSLSERIQKHHRGYQCNGKDDEDEDAVAANATATCGRERVEEEDGDYADSILSSVRHQIENSVVSAVPPLVTSRIGAIPSSVLVSAPVVATQAPHAVAHPYSAAAQYRAYAMQAAAMRNTAHPDNPSAGEEPWELQGSGRKRARDIDRMLAQGDMSALEGRSVSVLRAADPATFNPMQDPSMSGGRENERTVTALQYNASTGTTEYVKSANRTQRQKHHINSLASQALSMEQEILDKKNAGKQTRAQCAAKYGW